MWNQRDCRRKQAVHREISDIFLRFNPYDNYDGDLHKFNEPHVARWYPEYYALPAAKALLRQLVIGVGGGHLGVVLITRIPPGGRVYPHRDGGWHADWHTKYAVQLQSAPGQAFCFEAGEFSADPGEVYTFDNSQLHWVYNMSDEPRMTLLAGICHDPLIRKEIC